ncbi:MAG: hypothetical protein JWN40_4258 [Phycisphaerales bacterium]|nr:hypothetical protein [Phycisphaerales bacterium]
MKGLRRILINLTTMLSLLLCASAVFRSVKESPRWDGIGHVEGVAGAASMSEFAIVGKALFIGRIEDPTPIGHQMITGEPGWDVHLGPAEKNKDAQAWALAMMFSNVNSEREVLGVQTLRGRLNRGTIRTTVVPLWYVAALLAVLPFARGGRWWVRRRRARRGQLGAAVPCPACGYDCRATPGRCPECGREALLNDARQYPDHRAERRRMDI